MKKTLFASAVFIALLITVNLVFSYRRYDVILITVDTLRADYLSCYNPAAAPTPNIDRIAREGVLFKNAYSLIPITLPSHTAILSSHPPEELHLFNNGDTYYGQWPLLPDILGDHHYHTAGFVSLPVLRGIFGLNYHFNRYEDDFENCGRNYKVASEVNALALPWIEKEKKNRFFAWIHYSDPHEPYITVDAPPDTAVFVNNGEFGKYCLAKKEAVTVSFMAGPGENEVELRALVERRPGETRTNGAQRYLEKKTALTPANGMELGYGPEWQDFALPSGIPARYFDTSGVLKIINHNATPVAVKLRVTGGIRGQRIEEIRRNYTTEVQYADKYIGLLWQKLVDLHLQDETILVLTADHGEGLKTHRNISHVNCLYNEAIHVPFIIRYPNLGFRGKEVHEMVNHLDIVPTILDLLHMSAANLRGHSLEAYVSFSPIDRLFARRSNLQDTFSCTYAPQAFFNAFSMVNGNIKLIDTPERLNRQWEVYDLAQDPGERNDLVETRPDRLNTAEMKRLRAILEDHRDHAEAVYGKYQRPDLDEETSDMLKALGYVHGGKKHPPTEEEEVP